MKRGRARKGIHSMNQLLSTWKIPQQQADVGMRKKRRRSESSLTGPYILEHCSKMEELEKLFVQVLPADMREKFNLAKYDKGELVVFCVDAHYASYLKYHTEEIIRSLTRLPEFEGLAKITVHREKI